MKKVLFSLLLALVCLPVAIAQTKDAPVFQRIDKTICGSYTWDLTGETYSSDTAVMAIHNDTAYVLFITMAAPTYDTVDTVRLSGACSVTYRGVEFTTAGTFDATLPTRSGCDSIVRLSITLTGIDSTDQTIMACDSLLAPWGEMLYASANIVKDTVVGGCQRHDVLNLTINNSYQGAVTEVTAHCSYAWNGMTITDTALHTVTLTTAGGCDSIESLRVTSFDGNIDIYDTVASCGPYTAWTTLSTSGDYTNSVTSDGCTTTTHLNLTVNPVYTDTTGITVNDVTAGCYYVFAGQTYTDTNVVHYGTITTAAGCDSVAAIRIVAYTNIQFDTARIEYCGYRYPWGSTERYGWTKFIPNPAEPDPLNNPTLATSDDYVSADTSYTAAGCTYNRHIEIKFIHNYDDTLRRTSCESYSFVFSPYVMQNPNGSGTVIGKDTAVFTQSGVYTTDEDNNPLISRHFQTYCITHHVLNVNIIEPPVRTADTIVVNTCDKYTFKMSQRDADSATFTSDTMYTRIRQYRSTTSCYDTVIPLNITIRHSSFVDNDEAACDSYTWAVNGRTYTNSIIINDTISDTTNAVGCDSIGRLHLSIRKSPSVVVEGNWILEPGQTAVLNAVCTMPGVTYDWYKNNVLQSEHGASLTIEPNGLENIDVRLETSKVYTDITCVTKSWITVTTNVGIDDVDALQVNIYPNPTSRILNLESAEGIGEVVIYNMIGQQVLRQQGNGERMQLDLGALAGGNYTLTIIAANGIQTTRKINVTK